MTALDISDEPRLRTSLHKKPVIACGNTVLFYLLVAANLIPLWAFRFPSQDGPGHIYVAIARRDYELPERQRLREFFQLNDRIVPNWICPHVMPYLVSIFSPETAEKMLLSVYLILLPLTMRYALGAIRPRAAALAIAGIPFVPNYYYHMGFEDFCMSLPLFFFCIGYWLRHRRAFEMRHMLMLAGLLVLTYLTHIVGAVMAGLFLMVLAWMMGGGEIRHRLSRVLKVVASGTPAALFTIVFLIGQRDHKQMRADRADLVHRLKDLIAWQKAFASREIALAAINIALFAGMTIWLLSRRRQGRRRPFVGSDAFLLIAVICAALFLVVPDAAAGGSMLVVRLVAFIFFSLLLWWGAQPIGSRAFGLIERIVTPVSAIVAVLLLVSISFSYVEVDSYRREMESAVALVQPNSTLFATQFSPATIVPNSGGRWLSRGPDPLLHAAYFDAANRGIVAVDCQPATTNYYSIQFRNGLSPGPDGLEDYDLYQAQVGKPIEYVLLWTGGGVPDDDLDRKLVNRLAEQYDLIYTSSQTGYAKLYRLRSNPGPIQNAQVNSNPANVQPGSDQTAESLGG